MTARENRGKAKEKLKIRFSRAGLGRTYWLIHKGWCWKYNKR